MVIGVRAETDQRDNNMNLSHALLIAACATLVACNKTPTPSEAPSTPPATTAPSEATTPPAPPPPTATPPAPSDSSTAPKADDSMKKDATPMTPEPKK
jgi:hypothetical protein